MGFWNMIDILRWLFWGAIVWLIIDQLEQYFAS